MNVTLRTPIRTKSESNQREHWAAKARRVKNQREAILLYWFTMLLPARLRIAQAIDSGGLTVKLVRIAPRSLDSHDNLRASFKAIVDQLSQQLCVDDSDQRVTWEYGQHSGEPKQYGVEITFTTIEP